MHFLSVLSISCVILSVTCAPQRYWSSDESEETPRPYWLSPRRSSYPQFGSSFSDEMTRMLDELQKSILSVEVNPQFVNRGRFPVVAVSTGTGDEDESEAGSSVSIGGTGFGSLFNIFGGFDTKDLKNKTTVKTEIVNGHKVVVKESTYVSDNDGFKSVIHLSEVDVADSDETESDKPKEGDKPKESTPKSTEEEDTDDKEKENKPKEENATPDDVEDKTENQTPETPEGETKSAEPAPKKDEEDKDKKVEEEDVDNRNSEENSIRSNRHPDEDVEEIETNGKDFYNYYNTVDRIKSKEEPLLIFPKEWSDNEVDSRFYRRRRETPGRVVSLQGDTRVNQILSEKQQSSGLYSIDPDAELLDDNYYEVEGRRPGNQQQVVFYRPNSVAANNVRPNNQYPDNGLQVARRPAQQYQRRPAAQQQARPPRYDASNDYQRALPLDASDFQRTLSAPRYNDEDDYQRVLPVNPQQYLDLPSPS